MMRHWLLSAGLLGLGIGISTLVQAHGLVCQCAEIADRQIQCKGGFGDGSGVPGVTVDVIGYDEKTLIAGKFGQDSTFTFPRPKGEFYVLMDVGAGHTLEVDYLQVKAAR